MNVWINRESVETVDKHHVLRVSQPFYSPDHPKNTCSDRTCFRSLSYSIRFVLHLAVAHSKVIEHNSEHKV